MTVNPADVASVLVRARLVLRKLQFQPISKLAEDDLDQLGDAARRFVAAAEKAMKGRDTTGRTRP